MKKIVGRNYINLPPRFHLTEMHSTTPEFPTSTKVLNSVRLSEWTSWRIGGCAKWFWEPVLEDVPAVLSYCRIESIPTYFLGRGSNVLISDAGLQGLVICSRNALQSISELNAEAFIAAAGASLPKLSNYAARSGITGYEFLVGIPGTVGGALVMNAGLTSYYRREISDVVEAVEIAETTGVVVWRKSSELGFSYRNSALLDTGHYVLRAKFKALEYDDPIRIRSRTAEHLAERKRKQPLTVPTAGSTFKAPAGGKPAGWYIEQAGLKGLTIGGARISPKHANWIENIAEANFSDIIQTMETVEQVVFERFGVRLEREVRILA